MYAACHTIFFRSESTLSFWTCPKLSFLLLLHSPRVRQTVADVVTSAVLATGEDKSDDDESEEDWE